MKKMTAAVFEREGILTLKEMPVPVLEENDQLVLAVDAVSICGTDVHITAVPAGYLATPNTILGHELVGTVVEKGAAVTHLELGDRVVVNPNYYCGVCQACLDNRPNQCANIQALGIDYHGAFAKYVRVSGKVAHKISKSVPVEIACCAEPLACAIHGVNKISIHPGDSVVVIGAGPIGLMIAMLARASGAAAVYLLETVPYRLEFAKTFGFAGVIDAKNEAARELLLRETGGHGVDSVFDVTGSQMNTAIELVRKGGTVVLFGVNANAVSSVTQATITMKEIAVLGTWLANATFPQAVKVLESGMLDIGRLITAVLPLARVQEGIDLLKAGQAVKIVVKP